MQTLSRDDIEIIQDVLHDRFDTKDDATPYFVFDESDNTTEKKYLKVRHWLYGDLDYRGTEDLEKIVEFIDEMPIEITEEEHRRAAEEAPVLDFFHRLEAEPVPEKVPSIPRFFERFEAEPVPEKPTQEQREGRHMIKALITSKPEKEPEEFSFIDFITIDKEGAPVIDLEKVSNLDEDGIKELDAAIEETLTAWLKTINPVNDFFKMKVWLKFEDDKKRKYVETYFNETTLKRIIAQIQNGDFITAHLDPEAQVIQFSDSAENPIADWYYVERVEFERVNKPQFEKMKKGQYKTNQGGYFPYFAVNVPDDVRRWLKRYQITTEDDFNKDKKLFKESCLIYAMRFTEIPSEIVDELRYFITERYLTLNKEEVEELLTPYNIGLKVRELSDEKSAKTRKDIKGKYQITVNKFEDHYYLHQKTPFTADYIKYFEKPGAAANKRYRDGGWRLCNDRFIDSGDLIKLLKETGHFVPMSWYDVVQLPYITKKEVPEDEKLDYNEKGNIRGPKPKPKHQIIIKPDDVYFADFEATTQGNHKEFMICVSDWRGEMTTFKGRDCAKEFIDFIPSGSIVYFHNLKYDINFLAKYGITGQSIKKGKRTYQATIKKPNWNLDNGEEVDAAGAESGAEGSFTIKDSAQLLTFKISQFPKIFHLDGIEKEAFPYEFYTYERLDNGTALISEALEYFTTDEEKERFKNGVKISNSGVDGNRFDLYKYAEFYCLQDVNILRRGFIQFRKDTWKALKIDTLNILTTSSLANEYFTREVYSKNKAIKRVGGKVAAFIRGAVYGGRVMTAYNKKHHTVIKLADFDAVSLYPSAMKIMRIPLGAPKVWSQSIDWQETDYCVLDVEFSPVAEHRAFPLFVVRDGFKNVWSDTFNEPIKMRVGQRFLMDIIEAYPSVKYQIIRGYYWDQGCDYEINDVIERVFNERLKYKKEKNPLEQIYKLIMNSSYGKTIQKPIDTKTQYMKRQDMEKYVWKNRVRIDEVEQVADSDIFEIKEHKQPDTFNYSYIGVIILDYSKHIMNEVFNVAHKLGINIYYQDTDSMHIEFDKLDELAAEYKKVYGRELIGKNLGQFHNDFDGGNYAVESWFLGKKAYLDKLDTGKYHVRMKGVPGAAIEKEEETYKRLYNGEKMEFDITKGSTKFNFNKDFTVRTNNDFKRILRF